jgi:HlyD family type I secretion membrane fusion protein
LDQAIARAVAFNLQRWVKQIEREIEDAELQTKSFEMLPSLDLDAARNATNEELSASDDRITGTASAGITWNILDLGVSYARAKQQADEVLIAREKERKALQDIIREVRTAYWRAAGAERLMGKVQAIARNIKVAMRESRAMEKSGANDVVKSVAYRREIVESVRQALTVQRELREARGALAEHLNIRPGTPFKLATTTLAGSKMSQLQSQRRNEALEESGRVAADLASVRETSRRLGDRVQRLDIVAPVHGIVKGLATNTVGGVIPPGGLVSEIVPMDKELIVEARISPVDIGHITIGHKANVKVTTFDFARFGAIEGIVTKISASTFKDRENEVYYKAEIKLKDAFVGDKSKKNRILPGMVTEIDINTGQKTVLRYLLRPVFQSLDVALSER